MTTKTALMATLLLAAAACNKDGGSSNPPADGGDVTTPTDTADGGTTEPAGDGGEAKTEPGAPEVKWADKDFQQRKEWMGVEVWPKMKALFQEHDEAQFKGFKCETCHGDDGKDKNYAMPSDAIYPLDPKDPVGAAMAYDETITKFMVEKVVPEMATLLDTEPYDAETGEGFGCFGCHPQG